MDVKYNISEKQMEEMGIEITGETCSSLICEQGENMVYLVQVIDKKKYQINSFYEIK